MRYAQVEVTRNEAISHTVTVTPWELPLLEFVHPRQEGVVQKGFVDRPDMEYPADLESEYARLDSVYRGAPNNKGDTVSVVSSVYGEGTLGLRRLGEEVERAKAAELATVAKKPRKAANKDAADSDTIAA